MVQVHSLGFPRVGKQRELKFALEGYWRGEQSAGDLAVVAKELRREHWLLQSACDWVPVGDFSLYDHVLDTSFLVGNVPHRVADLPGEELDNYFRLARGRATAQGTCQCVQAGEMTKWFDTNYHYIVPELTRQTTFTLNASRLKSQLAEAQRLGVNPKPVLVGPVTYLWLSKQKDDVHKLDLLTELVSVYRQLLQELAEAGAEWVQLDEPILVTDLNPEWRKALEYAYHNLKNNGVKILLATYFGRLTDNLQLACTLPVAGLHIDALSAPEEVSKVVDWLPHHKVLSLGVISGRNVWKSDLNGLLNWLEPIATKLSDRLWLAPSCSLLHVPVDLECERNLDADIHSWLAFAVQKLDELNVLKTALNEGRDAVELALESNAHALKTREASSRVSDETLQEKVRAISPSDGRRKSGYTVRRQQQRNHLKLPLLPTTTIGSFPQTQEIRQLRKQFKNGQLDELHYQRKMREEIRYCIAEQERIGLDVLVHGEAERNDMVEYFGQQLEGIAFTDFGWVQSYGSRCVKPPLIYGDVKRKTPMTVPWATYAQSLSEKPVKGMLTGPVTILNWSFVRDDQRRETTCKQIALAIRHEVLDLEQAGIRIIQIDEAALREGMPLRKSEWEVYLQWAVESFRISANGVSDETQIHTHMCYSEFNDIIDAIVRMDADVITIENSRSDSELLAVFEQREYPNEIGPGVYDIHSPNIPEVQFMVEHLSKITQWVPVDRLWVNPDCGLKTRRWEEVLPALKNMVEATQIVRQKLQNEQKEEYATVN